MGHLTDAMTARLFGEDDAPARDDMEEAAQKSMTHQTELI